MSFDMFPQAVVDSIVEESDLLYQAWGIIANVSEGDWTKQTEEWQDAATKWRDRWHAYIGRTNERNSSDV